MLPLQYREVVLQGKDLIFRLQCYIADMTISFQRRLRYSRERTFQGLGYRYAGTSTARTGTSKAKSMS